MPFEGLEQAVCSAVPLATVTSFRIGGPAEYFVEPRSIDELVRLFERCTNNGVRVRMLGGGSNILASDRGATGAVFRLSKMREMSRSGTRITCEAGVPLPWLVRQAEQWGLSGLEPVAGIPGTVGGAVAMNAGGTHGCIGSAVHSVTTIDRYGFVHRRPARKLGLGYRRSRLHGEIVVGAVFELAEKAPAEIAASRARILAEKAESQPLAAWSAGCIFRNPGPDGGARPSALAAGKLIDLADLKGQRVGHAVVCPKHANFIINEGGASADDVKALIRRIRRRVRKAFGIDLELELDVWN